MSGKHPGEGRTNLSQDGADIAIYEFDASADDRVIHKIRAIFHYIHCFIA